MDVGKLLHMIRIGYVTTQIAEFDVDMIDGTAESVVGKEKFPASWFIRSKSYRISTPKESGFLHWSPTGWKANRDAIRKAWQESVDSGRNRADTFEELEAHAEAQFKECKRSTLRWLEKEKAKIASVVKHLKVLGWKK